MHMKSFGEPQATLEANSTCKGGLFRQEGHEIQYTGKSILGLDELAQKKRENEVYKKFKLDYDANGSIQSLPPLAQSFLPNRKLISSSEDLEIEQKTSTSWAQNPAKIMLEPKKRPEVKFNSSLTQKPPEPKAENRFDEEWNQAEIQLERDWYNKDESMTSTFIEYDTAIIDKYENYSTSQKKRSLDTFKNTFKNRYQRDDDKWEEDRMISSGVDMNLEDDSESCFLVTVHDVRPPFLEGARFSHTQTVSVIKDPNSFSDLAKIAQSGSETIKRYRLRDTRGKTPANENSDTWSGFSSSSLSRPTKESSLTGISSDGTDDISSGSDYKKLASYSASLEKMIKPQSKFSATKTIKEQRESLPIYGPSGRIRNYLLNIIRDNQVVVIVGETGSGKTTQITQYLYEEGYADSGIIGCTQPRRVAAMSVAKRVADEMGVTLKQEVGYSIRFEDFTSPQTKIKYMTDGILLREFLLNKGGNLSEAIDHYSVIMLDEAHERSVNTDILFALLKMAIRDLNFGFKLIVTSATLDAEKFSRYFGNAPVIHIPGRTFPVDLEWKLTCSQDYIADTINKVLSIHLTGSKGDILIFLTGQEEIEVVCNILEEKLKTLPGTPPPLAVLPIYSQLPGDMQTKIFQAVPEGTRKCVVATNIAETSLTIDGVFFVIDCGYSKLKVFNPRIGMDSLQITPISQANANQRKGRAGRTGPGHCYRLYSEIAYKFDMLKTSVPELQRTNLSNVILLLKSLDIEDLLNFEWMDAPPQDNIINSLYHLWLLGAIDDRNKITSLGRKMSLLPLDPSLSKMLLYSELLKCSDEVLTIVAMLSVPTVYFRPQNGDETVEAKLEKFMARESDHLTLLNIYKQWEKNKFGQKWCKDNFLQFRALKRVHEIRDQLKDMLENEKIKLISCGNQWDVVRKAITSAYFTNACRLKGIGEYTNIRTGLPCHLHPSSALFGLGHQPEYVIYHELIFTSKEYMRNVSEIDPNWLSEARAGLFTVVEYSNKANEGVFK